MKLLQVPTMDLNSRIEDELMDNPALEVDNGKEESTDELADLDNSEYENGLEDDKFENDNIDEFYDSENYNYYSGEDEEANRRPNIRAEKTFHDHLNNQLDLLKLTQTEKIIGKQIIGSIDEDGFLRREPSAIKNDLYFSKNLEVSVEEIEKVLQQIQTFDPIGVGARDLQETLIIQLKNSPHDENDQLHTLAIKTLEKYFNQFVKKQYKSLMTKLKVNEDELRKIIDLITALNPKPGSYFASSGGTRPSYNIIPDFFVKNEGGQLQLTLNSRNAPTLKISNQFKQIIKSVQEGSKLNEKQKETVSFAKHKVEYANWFIESIRQRQETLIKTMTAIMQLQESFFLTGDWMNLKPMILKDVADKIEMDISTVSRVVNQKYVETEHGIFKLKEFFSESMVNTDGEEISNRNIKITIEEIINNEDKTKPFSDIQLQQELKEKGYKLARRTVSKYREQLNFPVARLRKEL